LLRLPLLEKPLVTVPSQLRTGETDGLCNTSARTRQRYGFSRNSPLDTKHGFEFAPGILKLCVIVRSSTW
jgi:hypothetical protein